MGTNSKMSCLRFHGSAHVMDHKFVHITTTVNKCQQILSIIKRSFDFIDENIMTLLYSTLVRPIIEYSNVIWAPHLRKHINMIEAVQRRATRIVPNLKNLNYHERLKKLNLYSLAYRRRRGDLIQVFKLMHSIDNVDYSYLFEINFQFNSIQFSLFPAHTISTTSTLCAGKGAD